MVELKDIYYRIDEECKINEELDNRIFSIIESLQKEGNVFAGNTDRYITASAAVLITYNNKDAGFIYLTLESRYKKGLFIDMALLKGCRGYGIGKTALKEFLRRINVNDYYLIGEVVKCDIASNKLSQELGERIVESNKNFYIFPKERYKEFIENEDIDYVREALSNETKDSHSLLLEAKKRFNQGAKEKVKVKKRTVVDY